MKRGVCLIIVSVVVLTAILPATSSAAVSAAASTSVATDKASDDSKDKEEYELVTGLDFSYWAGDTENIYGPGINFGFILIPRHLELTFSVGAMTGTTWHMIPVEMSIDASFHVLEWLSLYVTVGPTIMSKKTIRYTKTAWALSGGAGFELLPVGFDWGIYAEFDYNYRFGHHRDRDGDQDKPHTYGFTAGFNYRF